MANENDVVRLKHLQPLVSGVANDFSIQNGDNAVRLKHLVSLATALDNDRQTPVLSLGSWSAVDTVYSAPITYTGDGKLTTDIGRINGRSITLVDSDGTFDGVISAREGANFAPAQLAFSHTSEIVELADYSDGYDAGYDEGYAVGYDEGGGGVTGLLDPNFTVYYDNGMESGSLDDETTLISVYDTDDCTLTCTWEGEGTLDYILLGEDNANGSITYEGDGVFIISNPHGAGGTLPGLRCLLYSDGEYAAYIFDLDSQLEPTEG